MCPGTMVPPRKGPTVISREREREYHFRQSKRLGPLTGHLRVAGPSRNGHFKTMGV